MNYNCPVCILTFRDSHDANKHFATKSHITKCLEENQDIGLVDINSLTSDEEELYILAHPYYKEQIEVADNTRIKLVKEENELLAQLGMFFNYKLNYFGEPIGFQYFDTSKVLTGNEIDKLVNDMYPYPDNYEELPGDDQDKIDEDRSRYRQTVEGLRTLSTKEKEDIKSKIENIRSKLQQNHFQNFQPKQLKFYKESAKRRILAEYKAFSINIEKKKLMDEKEAKKNQEKLAKEQQKLIKKQKLLQAQMEILKE
jgi:hypothetical protein